MTTDKRELAVAALQSGTVIDHIPSASLIKVADTFFPEATLNRIALIAPSAVVNIIRNYEVVEKRRVELPEVIKGIVKCDNPKCITNNEPMQTVFYMAEDGEHIRCRYCNHAVANGKANIL